MTSIWKPIDDEAYYLSNLIIFYVQDGQNPKDGEIYYQCSWYDHGNRWVSHNDSTTLSLMDALNYGKVTHYIPIEPPEIS